MPRLSEDRRAEILSTLPPVETTIARIRDYTARSGMTMRQFAALVGYGHSTMNSLLMNKYSGVANSDVAIRHRTEAFMASHPVGTGIVASEGKLYETELAVEVRRWFAYCQEHRELACIYAPPGSGKTHVLKHLINELNRSELARDDSRNRAYLIRASINMTPRDLIVRICREVGAACFSGATKERALLALSHYLLGKNVLIVLDEGQLLDIACLEAVREVHDWKVGVLVAGSHRLKQMFEQHAAQLEQWNSRVEAGVELPPLTEQCARAIISAEQPDLQADDVSLLINDARSDDIYSRTRRQYISPRRIFKALAALNRLEAEADTATGAAA